MKRDVSEKVSLSLSLNKMAAFTLFFMLILEVQLTMGIMMNTIALTRRKTGAILSNTDNFRRIMERKGFVDKSLFLADILDETDDVVLILRPRRFGKSLNLSMLRHFLSPEVGGKPTRGLFENLKIAEYGEYMEEQGKYPVIYISFKGVRGTSYANSVTKMKKVISKAYDEHRYLLKSPKLTKEEKKKFRKVLTEAAKASELEFSIEELTRYLFSHYKERVWVLVDEYDTPVQAAFENGYYESMMGMIRGCLGNVLNQNSCLHRCVIVGVSRISKESFFSGIHSLIVYSVLQSQYSEHFGFTEEEVVSILERAGLKDDLPEIKLWYNGYQVGSRVVYNPWSILNYLRFRKLLPYWINTSNNVEIKYALARIPTQHTLRDGLVKLMRGESITQPVDEHTSFADLKWGETAIWGLLVMAGYLKAEEQGSIDSEQQYALRIPNEEVRTGCKRLIKAWLANGCGATVFENTIHNLIKGDVEKFQTGLKQIMEATVSMHDIARKPEAFYHGLIVGLTSCLHFNSNYVLKSNVESGHGRYDYLILSKDPELPTVLMEIKKISCKDLKEPAQKTEKLQSQAQDALGQIDNQKYFVEAHSFHKTNFSLLKVGIAFCGKLFELEYEHSR